MPGIDLISAQLGNIDSQRPKIKPGAMSQQIMEESDRVKNRIKDCLSILGGIANQGLENSPTETIH